MQTIKIMNQKDFKSSPDSFVKANHKRNTMTKRRSEIEPGVHIVVRGKGYQ